MFVETTFLTRYVQSRIMRLVYGQSGVGEVSALTPCVQPSSTVLPCNSDSRSSMKVTIICFKLRSVHYWLATGSHTAQGLLAHCSLSTGRACSKCLTRSLSKQLGVSKLALPERAQSVTIANCREVCYFHSSTSSLEARRRATSSSSTQSLSEHKDPGNAMTSHKLLLHSFKRLKTCFNNPNDGPKKPVRSDSRQSYRADRRWIKGQAGSTAGDIYALLQSSRVTTTLEVRSSLLCYSI